MHLSRGWKELNKSQEQLEDDYFEDDIETQLYKFRNKMKNCHKAKCQQKHRFVFIFKPIGLFPWYAQVSCRVGPLPQSCQLLGWCEACELEGDRAPHINGSQPRPLGGGAETRQ